MTLEPPHGLITRRRALAASSLLLPWAAGCSSSTADRVADMDPYRPLDVPYVPTRMPIVRKMLEMGEVDQRDTIYDLGCGDGRIVITAVKERSARNGVGIDLNPQRIAEANKNAKEAGVADRVRFIVGDLFEANFEPATVVMLYLLPQVNLRLRPQLWRQLQPGTRVVSHAFDMGADWPPENTQTVDGATVYRWTIRPEHKKAAAQGMFRI
jgi:SAM-dependent methyltransferase